MEIKGSVSSNRLISYTLMFFLCLALLTVFSGCATPLGSAAGKGDLNTVSTLIKSGADLDEKDIDGYTALHHAAMAGHTEVVRLLIENGADFKVERNGFIPLHSSAYRGRTNVVRILLASGSEVNAKTDFGHTPLLLAASHGHTDVVRILIENGADLNAKDVNGSTAMHNAAFFGHTAVVRILLDAGADPSPGVGLVTLGARDTPLRLAQRNGYTAIASMLQNADFEQGKDYFRSGDYQQSMRSFARTIKLNPNSAAAYNNRGAAYNNMGQYDRAIADFNKALELNPNLAIAYNNRGIAYVKMGQYDQAIKDYRVAARFGNENAQRFLRSRGIDWKDYWNER